MVVPGKQNIKISELFVTHLRVRVSRLVKHQTTGVQFSSQGVVLQFRFADTLCRQFATYLTHKGNDNWEGRGDAIAKIFDQVTKS